MIPRRDTLSENTPEEMRIRGTIKYIELLGSDPLLKECVILLDRARCKLSDYIDETNNRKLEDVKEIFNLLKISFENKDTENIYKYSEMLYDKSRLLIDKCKENGN